MEQLDKEVIDELSESAKRVFRSLDYRSQRRMLKKAKEMGKQKKRKTEQKERIKKKSITKKKIKKEQAKERGSSTKRNPSRTASFVGTEIKDTSAKILQSMLLGTTMSEETYDSHSEKQGDTTAGKVSAGVTQKSMQGVKCGVRSLYRKRQQKKMQKQAAKKSAQSTKQGIKSASKAIQQIGKIMTSIVQSVAANPVVWIVLLVVLLMAVIVGAIGAVIGSGGAANSAEDYTYQAQVSEQTESYRDMVADYCEKYGIDDYVDLCLAVIEQESGGNPPDVMQTVQSYYNVNPPIDTAEESIDCGTHELSDCLTKAKSKSPNDIKGISLALQGYNFGNGYIDWALKNYGCYSKENAEIFSQKMCAELGYDSYGDVEYVPHVLRYYIANPETTVTNESANSILKELKENNTAPAEAWEVIEKGASLIGSVKYSMEKRQADGRDNPEFLDCSSFTAWTFHKSGITSVPYASTTATFISSKKFEDISGDKLQPGDIGLKSKTGGTGGANHVGIYCGTLKNGTVVWIHCTSSSSTSLTGNSEGAMFGAYTNFTYFRRLKKWNKD